MSAPAIVTIASNELPMRLVSHWLTSLVAPAAVLPRMYLPWLPVTWLVEDVPPNPVGDRGLCHRSRFASQRQRLEADGVGQISRGIGDEGAGNARIAIPIADIAELRGLSQPFHG